MTTTLQPVQALVPGANLEAYVQTVNSLPLLTVEQERELAISLNVNGKEVKIDKLCDACHRKAADGNITVAVLADVLQELSVGATDRVVAAPAPAQRTVPRRCSAAARFT